MINLPIYRAKKIDSDEWIEGYLLRYSNGYFIKLTNEAKEIKIDPSTIAIHFPNMIDKNGKKIFASLSDDGVGGDIISLKGQFGIKFYSFKHENMYPAKTTSSGTILIDGISMPTCQIFVDINKNNVFEITGIHKAQPTTTQKE